MSGHCKTDPTNPVSLNIYFRAENRQTEETPLGPRVSERDIEPNRPRVSEWDIEPNRAETVGSKKEEGLLRGPVVRL